MKNLELLKNKNKNKNNTKNKEDNNSDNDEEKPDFWVYKYYFFIFTEET